MIVAESNILIGRMTWLQEQGVAIALDDFGTGFSSLSYLTKFPLNYIKIDKSFIANAPDKNQDAVIAKAIFALSESLGLRVISEGVEFKKHLDFVKSVAEDGLLQGYFLSKPIPPSELEAKLSDIKQA